MAWTKVGTLRDGKSGSKYIKLEKDVEIYKAGKKVELNDSRTLSFQDPVENIERLAQKGIIKDKVKASEQIAKLKANTWLKADIFSAPTRKGANS